MSLLMWECGLKPEDTRGNDGQRKVTPYVGVWIETHPERQPRSTRKSLLMWECGLKRK